jgi:hypothetical protein
MRLALLKGKPAMARHAKIDAIDPSATSASGINPFQKAH